MSKLKKNNNHPLYKYHPVRYAVSREIYITKVMDILLEKSLGSAYPIFSLPDQTINRVSSCFHELILSHLVSSKSNEFYPKHLRETFNLYKLSYQVSRQVGAEKMREYFSTYYKQERINTSHRSSTGYMRPNKL